MMSFNTCKSVVGWNKDWKTTFICLFICPFKLIIGSTVYSLSIFFYYKPILNFFYGTPVPLGA